MPGDHRMDVAGLHAALVGDVVAHRVALQVVAVVDEQRVGRLGADRLDDRRRCGRGPPCRSACRRSSRRAARAVQVGGLDDAQVRLARLRTGREGVERDHRSECGRAGKKPAAADAGHNDGHGGPPAVARRPRSCAGAEKCEDPTMRRRDDGNVTARDYSPAIFSDSRSSIRRSLIRSAFSASYM